jgi:uncharacterized RDD family membrane protein YckC
MHSAEPFDRRSVNDSSQPAPANEAWRAEVASRVNSYRARRNSGAGEQDSLTLDFGPAEEPRTPDLGSASLGSASFEAAAVKARKLNPAANAFDTNYYRRLNAQAMSAPAVAASSATAQHEPEAGYEEKFGAGGIAARLACDDLAGDNVPQRQEASPDTEADDLEFQTVSYGDAAPVAQRLADAESATLFEAARVPPGAAPAAAPALPSHGNLIVFPRPQLEPPLVPQPSRDELAEPVHSRPRILEVPEDIMPAMQGSLFPEIRLDADEPEVSASRAPEIEVPLQVVPVSARLMAGLADGIVVLAAGALFGAIACRALPEVPHTKPFWMMLSGVTVLLWAVYQHLFLLYGGRTVGMYMRGIHLSTFDGRVPEWAERRRRALFLCLSLASVSLGFLWALGDEDALCWHDRLSQTFPTFD